MSTEPLGRASLPIVYVPDWNDRARRTLLGCDWDKPRLVALARAMGAGSQVLEDDLFDVLLSTRLEAATGWTLDLFGAIVGEPRGPLQDEDYRRFVMARILANTCGGTPDELITIFALVVAPGTVEYRPMYPAGGTLQTVRPSWLADKLRRRVRRLMADVCPAGVAIELLEALPGYFGFDGDDAAAGYDVGVLSRVL